MPILHVRLHTSTGGVFVSMDEQSVLDVAEVRLTRAREGQAFTCQLVKGDGSVLVASDSDEGKAIAKAGGHPFPLPALIPAPTTHRSVKSGLEQDIERFFASNEDAGDFESSVVDYFGQ